MSSERIYNLTQHQATPEQIEAGVVDLPESNRSILKQLLTFDTIPTHQEMNQRASAIIALLPDNLTRGTKVMVGGAPFFMGTIECMCACHDLIPVHAFSKRVSWEERMPNGIVEKRSSFVHEGFIPAFANDEDEFANAAGFDIYTYGAEDE